MAEIRGSIEQMALVEVVKGADGLYKVKRSLRLTPSFGAIWYQSLDLGFPAIRESSRENPDSSGTYDETAYHGARAVAIELTVLQDAFKDVYGFQNWSTAVDWNSDAEWVSRLAAWMSPELRPRLYFRMKGQRGNARFLDLRPANFSAPLVGAQSRPVQMQFVNPSGKIFDFDQSTAATQDGRTVVEIKQEAAPTLGRSYPEVYPKVYPEAARGDAQIYYRGTVDNGFIARIYSDPTVETTDPRLTVTPIGDDGEPSGPARTIGFTGLEIPAGQFIEIDTNEKTVNLGGDPELRQNQYLAAPLNWPVLTPGGNQIDFSVGIGGVVGEFAYAEVTYYSAFLG